MKKFIALLLFAVMCLSVLVSCGNAAVTTSSNNNGGDTADTNSGEEENSDKLVVTDKKFDGYTYTILVTGNIDYKHGTQHFGNDFVYSEDTNESLSNAKYRWIKMTEEKFDITIEAVDMLKWSNCNGNGNGYTELNKSYQASDPTYDSAMIGAYDICNAARNGLLADLKTIDYINLENSWWDQVANKDLDIQGKMFYTTGDISIVDNVFTHCVFFNKDMIKAKNLSNPYDLVENNKWTLDTMTELIKAGADTAGEGIAEDQKVYGLLTWNDSMLQILAAADERIASVDENGNLTYTMYNNRTQTLYNKFSEIALNTAYSANYQVLQASGWDELRKSIFDSNRALFYLNLLSTTTHHRDSEIDYGILPYPKLEETQENYGHLVSSYHTEFFCVPYFHYDEELTGSVSEYMAAKGQETTRRGYYDDTLIGKQIRDDESEAMLDIIFSSRVFDVGTYYKVGNIPTRLGALYKNTTVSFQQIHNESGQMAESVIEQINNKFLETAS